MASGAAYRVVRGKSLVKEKITAEFGLGVGLSRGVVRRANQ
jgi:hypothetical protein